jgi:prepilin-type N-terminal cleavage/methylation domain-containing protein
MMNPYNYKNMIQGNTHNQLREGAPVATPVRRNAKGFTLIEIMVSVSLFLIVMVIVLGALLSIIEGNKKTQAINNVVNNLNGTVESMIRDIKTGYSYKCGVSRGQIVSTGGSSGCNPTIPQSSISFISTISGTPRSVQYWIEQDDDTGRFGIKKNYCPGNTASPATACLQSGNFKETYITSPEINIEKMEFYVKSPNAGSGDQPGVFLIIKGTARINPTTLSDFSIQTFISQRLLNY